MANILDGTKIAPHGLFYMENFEGRGEEAADERGLSCFAFEEEKGEGWNGSGATPPVPNEARPTL